MSSNHIDIINQMGMATTTLSPEMETLRNNVIVAIGDILCHGTRVFPLTLGDEHVGYLRALRMSERNWINRLYTSPIDKIKATVRMATTLSDDIISGLSPLEIQRVLKLIMSHSRAEFALMGWVYPFSTTSASERLWAAGVKPPEDILTPFGPMRPYGVSEIYTQWAYMAKSREDIKRSLQGTQDAVLILRGQVGKNAQGVANEINRALDSLKPNVAKPWQDMGVVVNTEIDFNDGWGHSFQDQSLDGLMREYRGMMSFDKHEEFMQFCMDKQREELLAQQERVRNLQGRVAGISYEEREVTPEDMQKSEEAQRERWAREEQERIARVDAHDVSTLGGKPWHFES